VVVINSENLYFNVENKIFVLPSFRNLENLVKIDMTPVIKCRILGEKSEKVKLEIMENAGHMPQSENPTIFNKILLDFLLNT
jgi:pimeloyl-ACP methyl ester carboxylesterase